MNVLLRTSRIDIATIHWMNNCFKERELSSIIYLFVREELGILRIFLQFYKKRRTR